ncbi:MAG: ribosome biogenesis GTPase Der [Patescibacteria group bacterium]
MKQVAIIGRTNVGKSTLFNKLIEKRKALISNVAGTTRDLNFGICDWQGRLFQVVDTGGLFDIQKTIKPKNDDEPYIEEQVAEKAKEVIKKSDLIIFLVDSQNGILKDDRLIAQLLKKSKKQYILVANKIDKNKSVAPEEFQNLGLGDVCGMAAVSGVGVGDLLDNIIKKLKLKKRKRTDLNKKDSIKVSIIGKPNAGKSSLLNQILGEDRAIVSSIPHTTREPQDILIEYKNKSIQLIDTAGIRRKSKVKAKTLESAGIAMSIKTLKRSDIALFVLDMSEPLSAQDAQLAGLFIDSGVSVIFVANKYDLLDIDMYTTKEVRKNILQYFPFLTWAPIIFTSAKSGKNTHKILQLVLDIYEMRTKKIKKEELNELVNYLMKKMPPPRQPRKFGSLNKTRAFISKAVQKDTNPPVFEINVTNLAKIPESYLRYLENNIRKKFKFDGTPIKIVVERMRK